jgi:hypothetical protein
MKNQINILNITGAVVSASLMIFSYFLPSLNAFSLAKKMSMPKIQKVHIPWKLPSLKSNKKTFHSTLAATCIPPSINQEKTPPKQIASLDKQKQESQSTQLAEKCEEPSKSNGCPKNLEYFTQRPRPKQTPEECITCKNLIACVCLIDN